MTEAGAPRRAAGLVVVRCIAGRYHYLLLRAYRYWDFPKGSIEPLESALAAAQRETHEETGLSNFEFRWGEGYTETARYAGNKVARYYLALCASGDVALGVNPALGKPEHHAYSWVDYQAGRGLVGPRIRAVLDWARAQVGESC